MENLRNLILSIWAIFKTKSGLVMENLALRQQLAVMKRSIPRPKIRTRDRLFWVLLCRFWAKWKDTLIIVKPDTVVRWHRKGFKLFWRWKSRPKRPGRPAVSPEIRNLVRKIAEANPTWGAPKIHGELLKLGIDISETTISNLLPRPRKPPSQTWRTFLKNHMWNTCSMDFFTVPTATFKILFVLVILSHDRRKVLHFNVTANPTAQWTSQQIVEAFPYDLKSACKIMKRISFK